MWLHIPSTCSPCSPAPEASTSESDSLCQMLERCATWRGKSTPARFWRRVCKTARWMRHLSGLTSEPSTASRGVGLWISSLQARRASPTPSPESEQATPMIDHGATAADRSITSCASSGKSSQLSFFSKTSPTGSEVHSDGLSRCEENFDDWVTRSVELSSSVQATLGRRIGESECSFWPTAVETDGKASGSRSLPGSGAHPGTSLTDKIQNWPTPDANAMTRDNRSPSDGAAVRPLLAKLVQTWPTPRAEDSECCGAHRGVPDTLKAATALWPTPKTPTGGAESAERKQELGRTESGGGDLQAVAQMWPTPQVRDEKNPRTRPRAERPHNPSNLGDEAPLWPSPKTTDWRSGLVSDETASKNSRPLCEAVCRSSLQDPPTETCGPKSSSDGPTSLPLWPTQREKYQERLPGERTNDYWQRMTDYEREHGINPCTEQWPTPQAYSPGDSRLPFQTPLDRAVRPELATKTGPSQGENSKRRLNVLFVEWLMSWPIGWSGCAPLATGSFRSWWQSHSSRCFVLSR